MHLPVRSTHRARALRAPGTYLKVLHDRPAISCSPEHLRWRLGADTAHARCLGVPFEGSSTVTPPGAPTMEIGRWIGCEWERR